MSSEPTELTGLFAFIIVLYFYLFIYLCLFNIVSHLEQCFGPEDDRVQIKQMD